MSRRAIFTVLTIDDEEIIRRSFRDYLEDMEYQVFEAGNGRIGMEVFDREKPDVVLVDLRMPEMDGLDVLAAIRERNPDMPVIVISGTGYIGDAVEALHLGAWDYLIKPIQDLSVLSYSIEKVLERARLIMENRDYRNELEKKVAERTEELGTANKELLETNKRLRESEGRYRLLADNVTDVIWTMDLNMKFIYVSPSIKNLRGYTVDEVMNQSINEMMPPESLHNVLELFEKEENNILQGTFGPISVEFDILCKDGTTVPTETTISIINDSDNKPLGIIGVTRDMTERKKADEQLKTSLQEKVILLREIHHRVKNNMQVISSLLSLQAGFVTHEESRELFNASRQRIISMAMVHEKLYQSDNFAEIDFQEYLTALVNGLIRSYPNNNLNMRTTIDAKGVFLPVDKAIPCALIVNELVTNVLKYAFPDEKSGELNIVFSKKENIYSMEVSDTGVGFEEKIDIENSDSLGMKIVNALVHQLDATLKFDVKNGTSYIFTFSDSTNH